MKIKKQHGGYRPGSGRKPAEEKRVNVSMKILPSAIDPFRKKYGRAWVRRTEELMQEDSGKV